jgi:hypothetical protein
MPPRFPPFSTLAVYLSLGIAAKAASVGVANPSFHDSRNPNPGYGVPSGWNSGAPGSVGVNPLDVGGSPFSSGANVPDGDDFALIQGVAELSQALSGLDPAKTYALQFYATGRDCCGGTGALSVTYGAQTLLGTTVIPGISSGNYTFFDIPFTPATAAATLSFVTSTAVAGDHAIFLDAISLFSRTADQLVIANPSFEGSGNVGGVGYASRIAGWNYTTAGGGQGINSSAGPFYDNGVNSDGTNVALMQGNGTLSQLISGFSVGAQYELSYSYNSRSTANPTLQVLIGGIEAQNSVVVPVGGANPFYTNRFAFTATGSDMLLAFNEIGTVGDRTALIDAVSIRLIPEPSAGLLGLLGAGILFARCRVRK